MEHKRTKEEWMMDVVNHYEDGHKLGAEDMRNRIVDALKEHVDVLPDWSAAIELIEEITLD
jgi:hypothetical protein